MLKNEGKLPTHLLIGERKSGTSWIWKQLVEHPEIFVHPEKEVHFFDKNYQAGLGWYRKNFNTNARVIVDCTPDYFNKNCMKKIVCDLSRAKLFCCIRNPLDRAFSHFKFGKFIGNLGDENFIEVWRRDWNQVRTRGQYDIHLSSYLQHYDLNKNLLVLVYDDMVNKKSVFLDSIYDFLGVPRIRGKFFDEHVMPGPDVFWKKTNLKNDRKTAYDHFYCDLKMSNQDRLELRDYYAPHLKNLTAILDRDFSDWYS